MKATPNNPRFCEAPECTRKHVARGFCEMHLERMNRNGSLDTVRPWRVRPADRPACSVSGCDRQQHARTYCVTHYSRWRRSGSVELAPAIQLPAKPKLVYPLPPSLPGEQWRAVAGWEGLYDVSDLGRVRSLQRKTVSSVGIERLFKPQILAGTTRRRDGYVSIVLSLTTNAQRKTETKLVHALVAAAFIGPRPDGLYIAHGNGVPNDNRLVNLRYATPRENTEDMFRHGTAAVGERAPGVKISERMALAIRSEFHAGDSRRAIADRYGLNWRHVDMIVKRRIWKHV